MDEPQRSKLVAELFWAKQSAKLVEQPSKRHADFSLDDGYEVIRDLDKLAAKEGYVKAGRKIGFTNPSTWREFNLKTPIWAHVYNRTVKHIGSENTGISLKGMPAPRIEPEVVLKVKQTMDAPQNETQILNCLESISLGFEIVDCHYPNWQFTAADALADFGLHGLLIVGPPLHINRENKDQLARQLKEFKLQLLRNQGVVETGKGENALGSPLLALNHLLGVISQQPWADPVSQGDIITTGTLTPLPFIHPGETWSVNIQGIGLAPISIVSG